MYKTNLITMKNTEVTSFLLAQNHPLLKEIELLREIILSCDKNIIENIKWNGPNYLYNEQDRITMKINPPKNIQIIFHRGAKKQEQPKDKLINDDSGLMEWKENDRAVVTFKNSADIQANTAALKKIVKLWLKK